MLHSNTTLVKVKFSDMSTTYHKLLNSNTTLVKVKYNKFSPNAEFNLFKYNTC